MIGPGCVGWPAGRRVLAGECAPDTTPFTLPASDWLPPAERRRTGLSVRLALAAGREACEHAGRNPASLPAIFTSSTADGDNQHAICEILASDDRALSPTRFHNSVHNAPAGYWGVASGATEPSTSLCAFDGSFGAGLIEALTWIATERRPVLLVAYDAPYPPPLLTVRPMTGLLGVALVLAPSRGARTIAHVAWDGTTTQTDGGAGTTTALDAQFSGVPTAWSLPLLAALARQAAKPVAIRHLDGRALMLDVSPCP
ncbi:MAG: beta-ketoacyl synthase chain length factor [Burkholderiales bacterium]|nr:beta-ketoacyl synthase chain length factor [Burkholderiales bacterium]